MGGASSVAAKGRAPSGGLPASTVWAAPRREGELLLLMASPMENNLLVKTGGTVLLEVGDAGFRVLRADTEDAVAQFPWGQVHSWAHGEDRFSFRYFEERSKKITKYTFQLRHVPELMVKIQEVIDRILTDRKSQSISEAEFEQLRAKLSLSDPGERLQCIQSAAQMNFFMAAQAQALVAACAEAFDKVEAAAVLHPRLVDQNHFNAVLEVRRGQPGRPQMAPMPPRKCNPADIVRPRRPIERQRCAPSVTVTQVTSGGTSGSSSRCNVHSWHRYGNRHVGLLTFYIWDMSPLGPFGVCTQAGSRKERRG